MSIEANKEVARRYFEEFINERRLDVLEEIVAPDAVDETRAHSGGSGDRDDFRQHMLWLWEAVQDVKATITDLVAEGRPGGRLLADRGHPPGRALRRSRHREGVQRQLHQHHHDPGRQGRALRRAAGPARYHQADRRHPGVSDDMHRRGCCTQTARWTQPSD